MRILKLDRVGTTFVAWDFFICEFVSTQTFFVYLMSAQWCVFNNYSLLGIFFLNLDLSQHLSIWKLLLFSKIYHITGLHSDQNFCLRGLPKLPKTQNSSKKDKCPFTNFWGDLWQNSRPVCYFNFKNWNNKVVSDLLSMLDYTGIAENASLWCVLMLKLKENYLKKAVFVWHIFPLFFKSVVAQNYKRPKHQKNTSERYGLL